MQTIVLAVAAADERAFLCGLLAEPGRALITTSSAEETLLAAARCDAALDLLITEASWPAMSGLELARRIQEQRPGCQVICVAGESGPRQPPGCELLRRPLDGICVTRAVAEVLARRVPLGTVLVVDDDPPVRGLLCGLLSRAGYQVSEAANSAEAVQAAGTTTFDLVLTDAVLPGQSGFDLIREMRAKKLARAFVLISGAASEDVSYIAVRLGAAATLTKPVATATLLKTVASAIGAGRGGRILEAAAG